MSVLTVEFILGTDLAYEPFVHSGRSGILSLRIR